VPEPASHRLPFLCNTTGAFHRTGAIRLLKSLLLTGAVLFIPWRGFRSPNAQSRPLISKPAAALLASFDASG